LPLSIGLTHSDALILDPYNDAESVGFDPYELLRLDEEEFLINARQLALALIPLPAETKDKFWINSARNILTATIIHCFQANFTFTQTMDLLLETDIAVLRDFLSTSPYPEARKYINQVRGVSDKTLSSAYSELSDKCMVFGIDKKIMRLMTKEPRLDMSAYSHPSEPPPKLFIRIPPDKIEYYSNFVNVFFTFLAIVLNNRRDGQGAKLMIFCDEIAQFSKLEKLVGMTDTIASKNVILLLCMQALSQWYKNYGEYDTRTLINNCDTQIILKILDPDTQEFFSRKIGSIEIKRQSQSANLDIDTGLEIGRGVNNYIQEVRIVRPESMAYLAEKRETIFLSGKGYCKVRHVRYYEEKEFW